MQNSGLIVDIYRSDYNCSINKFNENKNLVLIDKVISGPFKPNAEMPEIKIVRRELNGGTYLHAEPAEPGLYAFGGSFIYTSDSRFTALSKYPIPLHDRQMNLETSA